MNVEIKGIHLEITPSIQTYIDTKMPRLDFAKELIVDFMLNLTKEKNLFKADATLNFRWGASTHVGVQGFDLNRAIDELFDRLDSKIEKEKTRIQDHHKSKEPAREPKE
jgi:putative sigma-54 modulation protein